MNFFSWKFRNYLSDFGLNLEILELFFFQNPKFQSEIQNVDPESKMSFRSRFEMYFLLEKGIFLWFEMSNPDQSVILAKKKNNFFIMFFQIHIKMWLHYLISL